jgi:hypothetical protein
MYESRTTTIMYKLLIVVGNPGLGAVLMLLKRHTSLANIDRPNTIEMISGIGVESI